MRDVWCLSLHAALVILVLGAGLATAAGPGAPSGRFELSSDPDRVVVSLSERFGEIEAADHPWMRIYADGRVVRHRPSYMKHPGDHIGQISPLELERLLDSLAGKGIMEFDGRAAAASKREAEQNRSQLYFSSDPSLIEIAVQLDSYKPAGSLTAKRDFHKTISWQGLRHDAKRFPEIAELQNLAAAFRQLNELAARIESEAGRKGESS